MEDNENGFVALWSDRVQLDCAVLYANSVMFDDPFFNRVTDIDCKAFDAVLQSAEREFAKREVKPFLHCLSNDRLKVELRKRGFVIHDTMSVLLYEGQYKLKYAPSISIQETSRDRLDVWFDLFCQSFSTENWREEITGRVRNSLEKMQLYIAYDSNSPAGCVALFKKQTFLGLYCLGTVAQYRGKGIATALISKSVDIARENNLKLFLQTFKADDLISYYIKRGFTQIYTKVVYTKN
ncbi:MAG: GNAT family N-acetyltransferase [Nitrososphaerales archaeon]